MKLRPSGWHGLAIGSSVLFSGFAAAHLIDDFVWDVPAEFHLTVSVTLWLAFLFVCSLVGLTAAAASGSRAGYLGLTIAGLLILAAQLLKSLPEMLLPGPWHSGLTSESLAVGLAISAGLTSLSSWFAWRAVGSSARRPRERGSGRTV